MKIILYFNENLQKNETMNAITSVKEILREICRDKAVYFNFFINNC